METIRAGANGSELPAAGGASPGQPAEGHPFGPNVVATRSANLEGKGTTIGFNCRVTVKGGMSFKRIASLFSGQDGGGIHIGGPDNSNDLTLELEGTVTFNGDAAHFSGQDGGGIHIGGPDGGGGPARRPAPASQQYDASRSGDGYQGN